MSECAKAIVLAAGLGTRLRPLTDELPKCLVPIAGKPLLDYWVDKLAAAGVVEARVNTHTHPEKVRAYVEGVKKAGRLSLSETFEPTLLGSAGTIAANADLADGASDVIIVYADNFSDVDLTRMLAFHRSHGDPFTMLLFRAPNPKACGIAELDEQGRVVAFVEKPEHPKSDLANGGVYIVSADAYREIAALGAFDLGFDVLPKFVGRMRGWPWEGYHLDVGTHEALAKARRDAPGLLTKLPRPTTPGGRPAVFLDRDGTMIEHVHYLADPEKVRLLPGAASAIARLRAAGFVCVVVTNQSAIGRGMLTEAGLVLIHDEMNRQLAAEGTEVDAIYYCPEAPSVDDRTSTEQPDRKPGPGMLFRASEALGLDLNASWMVGDMLSDVLAGINAGCPRNILVRTGKPLAAADTGPGIEYDICDDLSTAASLILEVPTRELHRPRGSKAFRAQGRPLVSVDEAGNIQIARPAGRKRQGVALHIGFDEGRARIWVQDLGRTQVIEFEVDTSFLDKLRRTAQREHGVVRDRTLPWRVDVDFPDQYAIPPAMLDELERAIRQGSGRILRAE